MAGAYTTLKLAPEDHQALQALLRFLAGKISLDAFRAVLAAQGRKVQNTPDDDLVAAIADLLILAVA